MSEDYATPERAQPFCPGCFENKGEAERCPHCGYDEARPLASLLLPHRTLLNREKYIIGKLLGTPGGFGITYLGWDCMLRRTVAIKEYMPRMIAVRDKDGLSVTPTTESEDTYRDGVKRFIEEARTLAMFRHKNVVRVFEYFEENNTAYTVMEYYHGRSLAEYVKTQPNGRMSEQEAIDIMLPILDGLREVHEQKFLHRDIKPPNIYLAERPKKPTTPILLDFGAARYALGEMSQSLQVVLTPGYAPYEQYTRRGKQGPWTDIYACAATLYSLVTGEKPPEAMDRRDEDTLRPPSELVEGISPVLEQALMKSLTVLPGDRTQTVDEFEDLLTLEEITQEPPPEPEPAPRDSTTARVMLVVSLLVALLATKVTV